MAEIRTPSGDGSGRAPRSRGRSAKAAGAAAPSAGSSGTTVGKTDGSEAVVRAGAGQFSDLTSGRRPANAADADASVRVISLTAIDRNALISMRAYFRAEQRNFEAGQELEDWLAAEAEVDAQLLAGSEDGRSA